MDQTLVIIDDFYPDPDEMRQMALKLEYRRKPRATYPGVEAIAPYDFTPVREALAEFIDDDVSGPCPKQPPFPQGKFRLALAQDEATRIDGVHQDVQPWSAIIYLSLPEHCRGHGAVGFYEHRDTGATSITEEWTAEVHRHLGITRLDDPDFGRRFLEYMRDMRHWREIQRVENRYNRALLLKAHCFHGTIDVFGTEPANGRLSQHFEYYHPIST